MDFTVNDFSRTYIKMTRERDDTKQIVGEILKNISLLLGPYAPHISEYIYQIFEKGESVHLSSWPKTDKKLIDKKLEEEFKIVLQIIERGLYARDKAQIGLKWPLASCVINLNKKLDKELIELIKNQLNIKAIELKINKENKEISVKLNTQMTSELEAEGYAREISRKVQAARKTAGLVKGDKIKLAIIVDENIKKYVETWKKFIAERVNAKELLLEEAGSKLKGFENSIIHEDKIKGKEIKILFSKV
jgi:isoleucyl-tRNA synthetase